MRPPRAQFPSGPSPSCACHALVPHRAFFFKHWPCHVMRSHKGWFVRACARHEVSSHQGCVLPSLALPRAPATRCFLRVVFRSKQHWPCQGLRPHYGLFFPSLRLPRADSSWGWSSTTWPSIWGSFFQVSACHALTSHQGSFLRKLACACHAACHALSFHAGVAPSHPRVSQVGSANHAKKVHIEKQTQMKRSIQLT